MLGDCSMLTNRYYFLLVGVAVCVAMVGCETTNGNYRLSYLKASAKKGDIVSQRVLGIKYYQGKEVPQDYSKAVKWFRISAERGDTAGQTLLGKMYYDGKGVKQDKVYAHMWWNVAATLGNKTSLKAIDKFSKSMMPAQLKEAQRLSRECVTKNYKGC